MRAANEHARALFGQVAVDTVVNLISKFSWMFRLEYAKMI
jgi:hypothetical protein